MRLINDLQALAYGIPLLKEGDLLTLQEGRPRRPAIAVIAAGTGLGQAYLTWDGSRYLAHASEGGHRVRTDEQPGDRAARVSHGALRTRELRAGLLEGGMPNIYAFLRDRCGYEGEWLADRLARPGADPAALIVETAIDGDETCEICRQTVAVFLSVLGAEAGNLALKVLATGGVPGRRHPAPGSRTSSPRARSWTRSCEGGLSGIVGSLPVHLVLNPRTGLAGAAHFGLDIMDTIP